MKELKFLRDNWAILLSSFFVLSLASIETSYWFFDFSILPWITIHEALIYLFKPLINIHVVTTFIFLYALVEFVRQNYSGTREPYLNSFIIALMSANLPQLYVIWNKGFFRNFAENPTIKHYSIFILVLVFFSIMGLIMHSRPGFRNIRIINLIMLFLASLVHSNVIFIEKNKNTQVIIRLADKDIMTGFDQQIIFQSNNIVVVHDVKEKTNVVIPQTEIKSIIYCSFVIP